MNKSDRSPAEIVNKILSDYELKKHDYFVLQANTKRLIEELLSAKKIRVHEISARAKTRESLEGKLNREGKAYSALEQITDLAGIRITTYFESDVAKVADLIKEEFAIDKTNSTNKGRKLDPDRFGYLSDHYVLSFTDDRCRLSEYKQLKNLKCEVQVRSILQHAWAEIEHDLGYKAESGIPRQLRRRFARLAGLFELADEEFNSIQVDLSNYEANLPHKIKHHPGEVDINGSSLRVFFHTNHVSRRIDDQIVTDGTNKHSQLRLMSTERAISSASGLVFLGIDYIDLLQAELTKKSEALVKLSRRTYLQFGEKSSTPDDAKIVYNRGSYVHDLLDFIAIEQKRLLEYSYYIISSMNPYLTVDDVSEVAAFLAERSEGDYIFAFGSLPE